MSTILIQEQKLIKASQILRIHGKKFTQIKGRYTDFNDGRCAIGVLADYLGWGGNNSKMFADNITDKMTEFYKNSKLGEAFPVALVKLNDYGDKTFDEIADWLEERGL